MLTTLALFDRIRMLKQCLNENSILGKKFRDTPINRWEYLQDFLREEHILTEISNYLLNLNQSMITWLFLVGPALVARDDLNKDFIHITWFLHTSDAFSNILQSKIQKYETGNIVRQNDFWKHKPYSSLSQDTLDNISSMAM